VPRDDRREQQRLPGEEGRDSHVHRVAYVAVETTDDETLGRRRPGRCADGLPDEANERRDQHRQSRRDEDPPKIANQELTANLASSGARDIG